MRLYSIGDGPPTPSRPPYPGRVRWRPAERSYSRSKRRRKPKVTERFLCVTSLTPTGTARRCTSPFSFARRRIRRAPWHAGRASNEPPTKRSYRARRRSATITGSAPGTHPGSSRKRAPLGRESPARHGTTSRPAGCAQPAGAARRQRPTGGLMFHPGWRAAALKYAQEGLDVIVIGGGITGCGIALDAAQRGLRTLLLERGDIASGTSSRSSKLIHGGLRYLKQMQFRITRLACAERDRMLALDPHLVTPIRCLYPAYEGDRTPGWQVDLGLWMYDRLTGRPRKAPPTRRRGDRVAGARAANDRPRSRTELYRRDGRRRPPDPGRGGNGSRFRRRGHDQGRGRGSTTRFGGKGLRPVGPGSRVRPGRSGDGSGRGQRGRCVDRQHSPQARH